jgi:hypothetical protein
MRFRTPTIRLAALFVLLVSASDYWAYDRWDPAASMSSSGSEAAAFFAGYPASTVSLDCASLPDDHCLFCSPLVAPPPPVISQVCSGSGEGLVSSVLPAKSRAFGVSTALPSRDPTRCDLPLRV